MKELSDAHSDLHAQLEELRSSEQLLKQRHIVLLRLALSQQNPDLSFDEKQRRLTKEIGEYLQVERTSIWFLDRDNTALRCLNLYVRSENRHLAGMELLTREFPHYLEVLEADGIVDASEARSDPRTHEFEDGYLTTHGITSMLDTALRVGSRLRGVLCCEHVGPPRQWTATDREFVTALADLASLTLATRDAFRNEETLQVLLDAAPQGIVVVDEQGRIVLVNALAEEMFLYKREELLGSPASLLFVATEEGLPPEGLTDTGLRRIPRGARVCYRMGRRKDGSQFSLEIAVSQIQLHGEHLQLGLLTDVTERFEFEKRLKKSEELYRTVVEDQIDKIARYTPAGIRTFANDAYCRFAGGPRDELIGACLWDELPAEDVPRMRENFAKLSPQNPVHFYEHADVMPSGDIVINQWLDRALFDAKGNVREIQSIGRDVTHQRETEERLRSAQRLESLAILASGIAHDFNNLLTPMLIYAENLQHHLAEGSTEERQAEQIKRSAEKARDLVRQILTFGKKRERSARNLKHIAPLLKDVVQIIRASTPPGIQLKATVDEDCGIGAVNATELYQIVSNLYSNACQAMTNGGTVIIRAAKTYVERPDLPSGFYAQVIVQDQGSGIAAEDVDHVFDPFFTTKPEGEGTGLGLSVVHGTVAQLGGLVQVTSQLGVGTTFTVLIPCCEPRQSETRERYSAPPVGLNSAHVLLVDDDEPALQSMQVALQSLGCRVTACHSAQSALTAIEQSGADFDIMLSDLSMPEMDGLDLAKRSHVLRSSLPILLVTGDDGEIDEAEAAQFGVARCLSKPTGIAELRSAIAEVTARHHFPVHAAESPSHRTSQILIVDDDELVCNSLVVLLRTMNWNAFTASSAEEARRIIDEQELEAVIIDHHLANENGYALIPPMISSVGKSARKKPLLIGMTGSEALESAEEYGLDAFLTKPFTAEDLRALLES